MWGRERRFRACLRLYITHTRNTYIRDKYSTNKVSIIFAQNQKKQAFVCNEKKQARVCAHTFVNMFKGYSGRKKTSTCACAHICEHVNLNMSTCSRVNEEKKMSKCSKVNEVRDFCRVSVDTCV